MYRVRRQDLPFGGSSHRFVGAENGDINVSVLLRSALRGRGPGPHRHPGDEIQFVREGRGFWIVNGEEFDAGAGIVRSSRRGRSMASAAWATLPWSRSMSISARAPLSSIRGARSLPRANHQLESKSRRQERR